MLSPKANTVVIA